MKLKEKQNQKQINNIEKKRKEKIISVCASVPVTHGSGTVWIYCNNKFSNVNEMCGMRLLSRNFCKCSYLLMHLLAIMKENSFICDDSPTDLSFILWLRFLSRFLISLAAHSWFYFISRINWYASIFIYLLIASVRMINWFESRLFFFRCRCTVFCLIFIMIIFKIVVRHIFHVIFIQNNNKSFKIFFCKSELVWWNSFDVKHSFYQRNALDKISIKTRVSVHLMQLLLDFHVLPEVCLTNRIHFEWYR